MFGTVSTDIHGHVKYVETSLFFLLSLFVGEQFQILVMDFKDLSGETQSVIS